MAKTIKMLHGKGIYVSRQCYVSGNIAFLNTEETICAVAHQLAGFEDMAKCSSEFNNPKTCFD